MVVVLAVEGSHMEGHFAVAGEGAKELFQHFSFKVTNEFPGQGDIETR